MRSPLPDFDHLVAVVDAAEPTELDRVRAAVVLADELGALGDAVVTHFVGAARTSGCSWSAIGAELGVSKQAAQQAFVAGPRRGRFGRRPAGRPHWRWSDEAGLVLKATKDEARALAHDHVGTEHLLLGLTSGEGVAPAALRRLGVDHDAVRRHVQEILGTGGKPGPARPPFTPRAKKVLELAVREAVRLRHDRVRTEHLLLAVVREGQGLAAQILVQRLGVDLALVTETVKDLLKEDGGPHTPGERPTG
jgi:hypothetical protein